MGLIGNSNISFIRAEEGDKLKIFMIHIIMTDEIIRIDTDQIAGTGEFNLVDKVKADQGINKIIGEEIIEVMLEQTKILEDRIVGENIEVIIELKITAEKEIGVGLEEGHFQGILIIEGMIEA